MKFHLVHRPNFLNVRALAPYAKSVISDKLLSFCDVLSSKFSNNYEFLDNPYTIKKIKGLVSFMNSEDQSHLMPEFFEYVTLLDATRKTDFSETFSELANIIEYDKRPSFSSDEQGV